MLDDLASPGEDDFGDSGYNPTVNKRGNRPSTTMGFTEDKKIKRNALFGIKDDGSETGSVSGTSKTYQARPQTTETAKAQTVSNLDDVENINVTVSRRGKRGNTFNPSATEGFANRPFTSPGIIQQNDFGLDDNKSATDGGFLKPPPNMDDDDDGISASEYLSNQGKRPANLPRSKINIDTSDIPPKDNTPQRSPISQTGQKDPFFPAPTFPHHEHNVNARRDSADIPISNPAISSHHSK